MAGVLLVGTHRGTLTHLRKVFSSVNVACETVPQIEAAVQRLETNAPPLVVVDKPADIAALDALQATIQSRAQATSFLVTLAEHKTPVALEAMRRGAFDCLSPPYRRIDVLAAAKRATGKKRRTLFSARVDPPRHIPLWPFALLGIVGLAVSAGHHIRGGPPPASIFLGSANLSGIQWDSRALWVGDWYDATVTRYMLRKAFRPAARLLGGDGLYQVSEGQPIFLANTPDLLVSIGSDLRMRSHHRSVGLPTLHSVPAPGTAPSGLAWDGRSVWTVDTETGLLYRHGEDLRVLETRKSLLPRPVGLAAEGTSLWVVGGEPLQAACLARVGEGRVWQGPFYLHNLLGEGVLPSGITIGFGRMWAVSGGDPRMVSVTLDRIRESRVYPRSQG